MTRIFHLLHWHHCFKHFLNWSRLAQLLRMFVSFPLSTFWTKLLLHTKVPKARDCMVFDVMPIIHMTVKNWIKEWKLPTCIKLGNNQVRSQESVKRIAFPNRRTPSKVIIGSACINPHLCMSEAARVNKSLASIGLKDQGFLSCRCGNRWQIKVISLKLLANYLNLPFGIIDSFAVM